MLSSVRIFLIFILILLAKVSMSQCNELSFNSGYGNWKGELGINQGFGIQWQSNRISETRHSRITQAFTDTNTCGGLFIDPDQQGGTIVRLGNALAGAQAEALELKIEGSSADLLIVNYAIVMEDPEHIASNQPYFEIRIEDQSGNLLDEQCGYYKVISDGSIPGFESCGIVRWKDWDALALDIQKYAGQDINIRLQVTDCAEGKHFGYGYFNVQCGNLPIQAFACDKEDSITITAPIGFDAYSWSTGENGRVLSIPNPMMNTSVELQMQAATSCIVNHSIPIVIANSPSIGFSVSNASCFNTCDASIQLESIAGRSPFTFNWSSNLPNTQNQNNLCPGEYLITVSDAVGCSVKDTIFILQQSNPGISLKSVSFPTTCSYTSDGALDITASKETETDQFNYEWSDNPSALLDRINLTAQEYYLTSFNITRNSCRIDTFIVSSPPPLDATFNLFPPNCFSDQNAFIQVTSLSGGNGIYSAIWNNDTLNYSPYKIFEENTVLFQLVDFKGCRLDSIVQIPIEPDIFINLPDTLFKTRRVPLSISAKVNANNEPYTTFWSPPGSYSQQSELEIALIADTTFKVELELTKLSDGCVYNDSIHIILVNTDIDFIVPTIFSPNEDGKSDFWKPVFFNTGTEIQVQKFRVFNRWGEMIYESNKAYWNGKSKNGRLQPIGSYSIMIEALVDGKEELITRQITLIR